MQPESTIEPPADLSLPDLQRRAEAGDAEAQYCLYIAYVQGKDVQKDREAATRWVRKAAEQGHALAQCNLAWMIDQGNGVEQDTIGAFDWFLKAAEGGDASAQNEVAHCYGYAWRGVKRDREKALFWLRKAAEHNDGVGQFSLANFYNGGGGDEATDRTLAYVFYALANRALPDLPKVEQDHLRTAMTAEQLKEADKLLASWQPGTPLPLASKTGKDPVLPLPT